MKKTIVKKLIIAVVVLFISFMGFQIVQKLQYKKTSTATNQHFARV